MTNERGRTETRRGETDANTPQRASLLREKGILRSRPLKEGYELMEASVPQDGADIARLLEGFPDKLYLRGRGVTAAQYLGEEERGR